MLISTKWLSEFVKLPSTLSDADLARSLSLSTVEVEGYRRLGEGMEGVVVGEILEFHKHPNADKLNVAKVDIGRQEPLNLIFGQMVTMNIGDRIPVAIAPTVLPTGVKIEAKNLRGVRSEGMLCLEQELGMKEEGVSLLYFPATPPGTPIVEALGYDDVIFDIEHKSLTNRPDLMGHYGMAREVAALTKSKLATYAPKKIPSGKGISLSVKVEDQSACPRYMAVALDGVVVGDSPEWMKQRLEACGVRSINNVVDVTNYVMLELGQPMHAFDADVLGAHIVVRQAKPKEKMTALDTKTYSLTADDLLITDGQHPIAIAGVMGGEGSGVSRKTTRVVFESANFNPVSVRKTSTRLALRSESSARFEKSLDPELCELALRRAVELMIELSPGARVASNVVDVRSRPPKPTVVSLSVDQVNAYLGTQIPVSDAVDILRRLGFVVKAAPRLKPGATMKVTVPSWRATKDISIVEDVIEEVARVWGYDRIAPTLPDFSIAAPPQDPVRSLISHLRSALCVGLGVTETYRYAFLAPELLRTLGFDPAAHLKLANPLAQDRPYLCSSLAPNLFDTVLSNHRTFPTVSVFEVARVFLGGVAGEEDGHRGTLPAQPYHLGIAYSAAGDDAPIVELRRIVEAALTQAGFAVAFREMDHPTGWMHPARAAEILVDGKKYGILAEAASETLRELGIDRRVAIAEMNVTMLAARERASTTFSPIPAFPDAKRDIAFTVGERTQAAALEVAVRKASRLLAGYELFDVYRGKGVEDGRKSVAVHLTFRALDRTLTSREADDEVTNIRRVLEKEFGAVIRS